MVRGTLVTHTELWSSFFPTSYLSPTWVPQLGTTVSEAAGCRTDPQTILISEQDCIAKRETAEANEAFTMPHQASVRPG